MQGPWWYLVGDSPRGPVSLAVLETMLNHGFMTQQSLVWKEGLSDWITVAELCVLRQNARLQSEPEPLSRPAPLSGLAPAGAWRRFVARMLDIGIISVPLLLLAWPLLNALVPGFAPWWQRPASPYLLSLALFPLVLLLESGVFAYFGTTPGKALLGVMVLTLDGQPLSAAQYLRRQLGVFWYGFAMGLPVISLIAIVSHGLSLQQGEPTPYDANRFTVRGRRLSRTQVLVLAGIGLAMAGIGCAMAGIGSAMVGLGY